MWGLPAPPSDRAKLDWLFATVALTAGTQPAL